MSLTRKAVPQNRIALVIMTASRGSTCAIIQTVLGVHTWWACKWIIFTKSHEAKSEHSEPSSPQPRGLNKSWFRSWDSMKQMATYFGNHYLHLCFPLHVPITVAVTSVPSAGRIAAQWPTSMLMKLCADCSRCIAEEGPMWLWEPSWGGVECWGRSLRGRDWWLTPELNLNNPSLLTLSTILCTFCPAFP